MFLQRYLLPLCCHVSFNGKSDLPIFKQIGILCRIGQRFRSFRVHLFKQEFSKENKRKKQKRGEKKKEKCGRVAKAAGHFPLALYTYICQVFWCPTFLFHWNDHMSVISLSQRKMKSLAPKLCSFSLSPLRLFHWNDHII